MKRKIIILVSISLFVAGIVGFAQYKNNEWNIYQQVKDKRVKDSTVIAEFNEYGITLEDVINMKNEFEIVNKQWNNNEDFKISEGQIIKNKLVDQFLLLEAKNAGILPVSDEEANLAKEEQLDNYQKVSDDIKKIQLDKIEELGLSFDEYWNVFWIEYYKNSKMIDEYITMEINKNNNSNDKNEKTVEMIKEEVYNKYKNRVILNENYNITLP